MWRHEADDGVERRASVEVDAHAAAGLEGGEGGLGDEETNFDVFRWQEGDDGLAGGYEFAGTKEGIVNEGGGGGGDGFLGDGPFGLGLCGEGGGDLLLGGGYGVGPGAEVGGGELRLKVVYGPEITLVVEADAVVVAYGYNLVAKEDGLAFGVEAGEFGGGAGGGETGVEGVELGRACALAEIIELGAGGGEAGGGLGGGRGLGGVFKGEERGGGLDACALGDGEGVETTGERRGDVNELALEVALKAGGGRAGAGGEREQGETA